MLKSMTVSATIAAVLAGLSMPAYAIADSPKTVDIPAGDLRQALLMASAQFGTDLVFSPEQIQGFKTGGAHGQLTTEQAVTKLLEGTRLELRIDPSGAMLIVPPAAAKEAPQASTNAEPSKSFWSRLRLAQTDTPSPSQGEGRGEDRPQVAGNQDVEDPAQSQKRTELEEVVVTGTHIRGAGPVGSRMIVLDRQYIAESGYGRIEDVLATLPQNFNATNETTRTMGNANRGAEIQLRGLGPGTTLTLVNGRRQAAGGTFGAATDISSIPASAIDHIEILADGASAIYGSDAVGGVVNIILRKDFEGAESSVRLATAEGERDNLQASQLMGLNWGDGNLLAGYQFASHDFLRAGSREYSAANGDYRAFGGSDFRVLFSQYASNPGTILCPFGRTDCAFNRPAYAIPSEQDGVGLTPADLIPGGVNYTDRSNGTILPRQKLHAAFATVQGRWLLCARERSFRGPQSIGQPRTDCRAGRS